MARIIHAPRIGKSARLSPSVSGFVFTPARDKLLLVRRRDNGRWCLPSGLIEPGESISEACIREVLEETGLKTKVRRIVGVYSDPDSIIEYPDGNRFQCLEIDLELDVVGGIETDSDETSECGYFSLSDLSNIDLMESEVERVRLALSSEAQYTK